MASNQSSGRRPALIPDLSLLSPEEAADVLRRRTGSSPPRGDSDGQPPQLENPFKPSQIGTLEDIHNEPQVSSEEFVRHKSNCQDGDPGWQTNDFHGKRSLQLTSRSTSRDKFRELNGQDTLSYHPSRLLLEGRSLDGLSAESERRRYSMDMSEDIPHMSEVPSETRVRRSGFITRNPHESYSADPTVRVCPIHLAFPSTYLSTGWER